MFFTIHIYMLLPHTKTHSGPPFRLMFWEVIYKQKVLTIYITHVFASSALQTRPQSLCAPFSPSFPSAFLSSFLVQSVKKGVEGEGGEVKNSENQQRAATSASVQKAQRRHKKQAATPFLIELTPPPPYRTTHTQLVSRRKTGCREGQETEG